MQSKVKKTVNYVDNQKFSAALLEWVDLYHKNKAEGLPKPPISNYIGSCILQIAKNLIKSPKFNRYSWSEEMIGDGIINAIQYLHTFNSNAETRTGKPNAFSWITMSMERVFFDRVEIENRQLYYRNKLGSEIDLSDAEYHENEALQNNMSNQIIRDMGSKAGDYENKRALRREKEKAKNAGKVVKEVSTVSILEMFG